MTYDPGAPPEENSPDQPLPGRKLLWSAPEVKELPRLTDLTLQTGVPIGGTGNPGGTPSTVF